MPETEDRILATRAEALKALAADAPALQSMGIDRLWLFGSVARDEAGPDSDLDLFFDHADQSLTLFDVMAIEERIAVTTGRVVDLMTRASLHPVLAPAIVAGAVRVF